MKTYQEMLVEMGISESRVPGLFEAINKLNSELYKLDMSGLRAFTKDFGIIGHLDQFAQCTGDRNIAREIYATAINKAHRTINQDDDIDYNMFASMLHYSAEQAAQLEIPGAKMLCKSLKTIQRQREGKIGLSFSRLAARVNNIFSTQTELHQQQLEIRETNKFVGTHRHFDSWTAIGNVTSLHRVIRHEDMDGTSELVFVHIWSDFADDSVERALKDTFSWNGCSCSHDCCGCVSQSVTRIRCLSRSSNIWVLKVSTSRNI